jgi:hypothetical protein
MSFVFVCPISISLANNNLLNTCGRYWSRKEVWSQRAQKLIMWKNQTSDSQRRLSGQYYLKLIWKTDCHCHFRPKKSKSGGRAAESRVLAIPPGESDVHTAWEPECSTMHLQKLYSKFIHKASSEGKYIRHDIHGAKRQTVFLCETFLSSR